MTYKTEFPDFPDKDMPEIPAGFEDSSWHNDTCPSFSNPHLLIWIDYLDPEQREWPGKYPRFNVQPMRNGIEITGDGGLMTDSWEAVLEYIAKHTVLS
jgi:hypothetical protein